MTVLTALAAARPDRRDDGGVHRRVVPQGAVQ
jgi:hypothetical protein